VGSRIHIRIVDAKGVDCLNSTVLDLPTQQMKLDDTVDLLPDFLLRLSNDSLNRKLNARYDPSEHSFFQNIIESNGDDDFSISFDASDFFSKPIFIEPSTERYPVVAVDVSSIRIGETSEGMLCALRGAVVSAAADRYYYSRCGPLAFHLTESTISSVFEKLGFPSVISPSSPPLAIKVLGRLRNALERWIQRSICHSFTNSLILLDGSLTTGTPDNPSKPVEKMLENARKNGDAVLALSKSTKLRIMGNEITQLTKSISSACLLEVDSAIRRQFPSYPVQLLGRIFVAKLHRKGFSFRLDVDRELSPECTIESVRRLLGSDIVSQGYPETLRLAHILSTFTANEVIAIQRFLLQKFGIRAEPSPNLRRSLFGPYGSSWEAN